MPIGKAFFVLILMEVEKCQVIRFLKRRSKP